MRVSPQAEGGESSERAPAVTPEGFVLHMRHLSERYERWHMRSAELQAEVDKIPALEKVGAPPAGVGSGRRCRWIGHCVRRAFRSELSLRSPIFFLVRTAPRDHQPPTANRQLPTAGPHQPPTANRQPPPTANRQLPTAGPHQPPTANRQPPSTATNRQPQTFEVEKVP